MNHKPINALTASLAFVLTFLVLAGTGYIARRADDASDDVKLHYCDRDHLWQEFTNLSGHNFVCGETIYGDGRVEFTWTQEYNSESELPATTGPQKGK